MIVKIYRGKDIIPLDRNGLSDPLVKIIVGDIELQSEIKKKTLEPIFNEIFYIPVIYPFITNKMTI